MAAQAEQSPKNIPENGRFSNNEVRDFLNNTMDKYGDGNFTVVMNWDKGGWRNTTIKEASQKIDELREIANNEKVAKVEMTQEFSGDRVNITLRKFVPRIPPATGFDQVENTITFSIRIENAESTAPNLVADTQKRDRGEPPELPEQPEIEAMPEVAHPPINGDLNHEEGGIKNGDIDNLMLAVDEDVKKYPDNLTIEIVREKTTKLVPKSELREYVKSRQNRTGYTWVDSIRNDGHWIEVIPKNSRTPEFSIHIFAKPIEAAAPTQTEDEHEPEFVKYTWEKLKARFDGAGFKYINIGSKESPEIYPVNSSKTEDAIEKKLNEIARGIKVTKEQQDQFHEYFDNEYIDLVIGNRVVGSLYFTYASEGEWDKYHAEEEKKGKLEDWLEAYWKADGRHQQELISNVENYQAILQDQESENPKITLLPAVKEQLTRLKEKKKKEEMTALERVRAATSLRFNSIFAKLKEIHPSEDVIAIAMRTASILSDEIELIHDEKESIVFDFWTFDSKEAKQLGNDYKRELLVKIKKEALASLKTLILDTCEISVAEQVEVLYTKDLPEKIKEIFLTKFADILPTTNKKPGLLFRRRNNQEQHYDLQVLEDAARTIIGDEVNSVSGEIARLKELKSEYDAAKEFAQLRIKKDKYRKLKDAIVDDLFDYARQNHLQINNRSQITTKSERAMTALQTSLAHTEAELESRPKGIAGALLNRLSRRPYSLSEVHQYLAYLDPSNEDEESNLKHIEDVLAETLPIQGTVTIDDVERSVGSKTLVQAPQDYDKAVIIRNAEISADKRLRQHIDDRVNSILGFEEAIIATLTANNVSEEAIEEALGENLDVTGEIISKSIRAQRQAARHVGRLREGVDADIADAVAAGILPKNTQIIWEPSQEKELTEEQKRRQTQVEKLWQLANDPTEIQKLVSRFPKVFSGNNQNYQQGFRQGGQQPFGRQSQQRDVADDFGRELEEKFRQKKGALSFGQVSEKYENRLNDKRSVDDAKAALDRVYYKPVSYYEGHEITGDDARSANLVAWATTPELKDYAKSLYR